MFSASTQDQIQQIYSSTKLLKCKGSTWTWKKERSPDKRRRRRAAGDTRDTWHLRAERGLFRALESRLGRLRTSSLPREDCGAGGAQAVRGGRRRVTWCSRGIINARRTSSGRFGQIAKKRLSSAQVLSTRKIDPRPRRPVFGSPISRPCAARPPRQRPAGGRKSAVGTADLENKAAGVGGIREGVGVAQPPTHPPAGMPLLCVALSPQQHLLGLSKKVCRPGVEKSINGVDPC